MIVFESSLDPSSRSGEEDLDGRRIAGRLLPYSGEASPFRFDPIARRFVRRRAGAVVVVGPPHAEPWRVAASRLPAGPVLVGPGPRGSVEEVRGAYRAAAEGALSAGRAVYLLDPPAAGLPETVEGAVVLCTFAPDRGRAFAALAAARARGAVCGVLFPLIPGWTAEPDAVEALLSEASAAGAQAATAVLPEADGESRRSIVEARSAATPEASEDFFERIHHQEWLPRMAERLAEIRRLCAARGLAVLPPRPAGRREPRGNAAVSARLEERAELEGLPEHRAASLRAAVRWIDESGRDLAAVAREGNFRRVFPFDGDLAAEAEAALQAAR